VGDEREKLKKHLGPAVLSQPTMPNQQGRLDKSRGNPCKKKKGRLRKGPAESAGPEQLEKGGGGTDHKSKMVFAPSDGWRPNDLL